MANDHNNVTFDVAEKSGTKEYGTRRRKAKKGKEKKKWKAEGFQMDKLTTKVYIGPSFTKKFLNPITCTQVDRRTRGPSEQREHKAGGRGKEKRGNGEG